MNDIDKYFNGQLVSESELKKIFCMDCEQRLQVINTLLAKRKSALHQADFDILYQEFDSLYGGARAANIPELESFFFMLAMYARFLKRLEQKNAEANLLLKESLQLMDPCGVPCPNKQYCPIESEICARHLSEQLQQLSKQMNDVMAKYAAR
jgi:hypothetical protein